MVGVIVTVVVVTSQVASVEPPSDLTDEVLVPAEHGVVSIAIDERVPPLNPGDMIDLYLGLNGFGGTDGEVTTSGEPSVVIETTADAVIVAVPDDEVAKVATALSAGSVLVVQRSPS